MAEPLPSVRWTCRRLLAQPLGHLDHVGARDGGVREVDRGVGVVLLAGVPAGEVHLHPAARGRPPRIHVLDREGDAGAGLQRRRCRRRSRRRSPSATGTAGARRPRRRRRPAAISADFSSLPHGSVPQTRCVKSRQGEWIAQIGISWCSLSCLIGVDLLAQRVDADHHLDRVVAQRRGLAEGVRGRLGIDRGGGEADQGRRRGLGQRAGRPRSGRAARGSRPRAGPTGRSPARAGRRCPCTPRRPARPARSGGCGSGETPGSAASSSGDERDQLRDPVRQRRRARAPAAPAARRHWARRRRCAPASGRSSRSRRPGRGRRAAAGGRRRGRSRRGSACAADGLSSSSGRSPPNHVPRQPGRAQRQRPRDVGRLVGAAGDLQRAATDVEDRQPAGRPAEPAAYGEEGQPRLVLAGQDLEVDAAPLGRRARARRRS